MHAYDLWLTTLPEDLDIEEEKRKAALEDEDEPEDDDICGQFYDGQ